MAACVPNMGPGLVRLIGIHCLELELLANAIQFPKAVTGPAAFELVEEPAIVKTENCDILITKSFSPHAQDPRLHEERACVSQAMCSQAASSSSGQRGGSSVRSGQHILSTSYLSGNNFERTASALCSCGCARIPLLTAHLGE